MSDGRHSAGELQALLDQVPPALRRELRALPCGEAFELARQFLASDARDRAGMMAFIEEEGPRRVRELGVRHRDGTPTAADLDQWLEGEA